MHNYEAIYVILGKSLNMCIVNNKKFYAINKNK